MEPVSLDRIHEVAMGDEEFMVELINLFLDDLPRQIEVLRRAIENHDAEGAVAAAHRLKGASGNLGAEPMSVLCRRVERLGHANRLSELTQLLGELNRESEKYGNSCRRSRRISKDEILVKRLKNSSGERDRIWQ